MSGVRPPDRRFEILDRMPVGGLVIDSAYRVLFWNGCLENWTGIRRADVLDRDARERFPALKNRGIAARIARVFRDGIPTVFSPQLHAPLIPCEVSPGVFRVQHVTVSSAAGDPGEDFLAVIAIQDITDVTRRLEDTRAIATKLAAELTTRRALERDLEASRDLAEQASRAKSAFLANMSHEIRTPMNGILGMNQLLLATPLEPRQRRYATVASESAHALLALIDDILDFSKIEAGKLELKTEDFAVRAMVGAVADLLAERVQKKGLELLCRVDPAVPCVLRGSDPGRVRQVLTNLVANAVKFTDKGDVSVSVRMETQEGPEVRFEIADTGIGITEEQRSLLFRPFSQGDVSTTRAYGGTGLGLSVSARLVELMGGRIGFDSSPGRGSTFWFTIPEASPASCRPPRPVALVGRRVLIVDPHPSGARLLAKILEDAGCEPWVVADVPAAVLAADARQPAHFDALLLDWRGIRDDVRKGCLRLDWFGGLVVLVAPFTHAAAAEYGLRQEFAAVVTKPLKEEDLIASMSALWEAPDRRAPPAAPAAAHAGPAFEARAACRLLLVEDNVVNQQVAVGLLHALGWTQVTIADNGRLALDLLRREVFDVVLMDCQLPEIDGYEATRRLRSAAGGCLNPAVPVIAMTAHAMAADRDRCLEAGMDDYISKPVRREALEQILDRVAANRPPAFQDPAGPEEQAATVRLDAAGLLERLMGDHELACTVLGLFLTDLPVQQAALLEALGRGDIGAVRAAAHSLKGAAANVGAEVIRTAAAGLEELAGAETPDTVRVRLAELAVEAELFRIEAGRFLAAQGMLGTP